MEENDAMQRKLRFIKDDLMNKTLGELLGMLKDAAGSGDEAAAQSAKYLEYMLSCGVVRSSDPANSVHMSGLDELVQVLAVHRMDTVPPPERPVNGFPVQMALSDLGPESPEHAAVRKAISSNADEDTIKKAKAAFVDHVLARAETQRPSYIPSAFNADDPMSFIRYLMRHVAALEAELGNLEDKVKAYSGKGANVRVQLDALRRRIAKLETEMHPGIEVEREPREDPYEDDDDRSMLFSRD